MHNAPEYPDVGERGVLLSPGFEINLGIYPVGCDNVIELDYQWTVVVVMLIPRIISIITTFTQFQDVWLSAELRK